MPRKERIVSLFSAVARLSLALLLGACSVIPTPLSDQAHALRAIQDRKDFYATVQPVERPITLADAMARAITYNLDHNLKMMEEALTLGQTHLSEQAMLPKLAVRAGYSSRNNPSGASSFSLATGAQSLEASSSAQRESAEADLSIAWNVLDFGVSYLRAKQQADRVLVAEERRRKVVHDIIQEVRQAFWRAVAAQRLMPEIVLFLAEARQALADSRKAENQLLQTPLKALEYQMALLETIYQITTLQRDLSVAKTQLAALINLDFNSTFTLLAPEDDDRPIPLFSDTVDTMENMAMIYRPELREEEYQKRMDATESRVALLQLMPGLGFNGGYNLSTNSFLFHQNWLQGSMQVAWNLVNIVNAPTLLDVAEVREKTAHTRRLSMSMAILTQIRVAFIRYNQTLEEYQLLSQMSEVAKRVNEHTGQAENLQTKTHLEQVQSKARAVYRHLQKELAYAELQNSAGRLYLSIGIDPLPKTLESHDLDALSKKLAESLFHWGREFQEAAQQVAFLDKDLSPFTKQLETNDRDTPDWDRAMSQWGADFQTIARRIATDTDPFPDRLQSYDLDALSQTLDSFYYFWRPPSTPQPATPHPVSSP